MRKAIIDNFVESLHEFYNQYFRTFSRQAHLMTHNLFRLPVQSDKYALSIIAI